MKNKAIMSRAMQMFAETGITITMEGRRHLGGAIGTNAFIQSYVNSKVKSWVGDVAVLTKIAQDEPQAA